MTWEQLIGKIREGLSESGARIRMLGGLIAEADERGEPFNPRGVHFALTALTLVVSDLHSTVEHMAIGLDALEELMREADKSQEVKGD